MKNDVNDNKIIKRLRRDGGKEFNNENVNLLRTGLVDISTTSVSYYFGIVSGVILYVEYRKHSFIILKSIFDLDIFSYSAHPNTSKSTPNSPNYIFNIGLYVPDGDGRYIDHQLCQALHVTYSFILCTNIVLKKVEFQRQNPRP